MRTLKGIVFALVLANVVYFLWARSIAPPAGGSRLVAVPRLTLASETAASAPSSAAGPGAVAPAMPPAAAAASSAPVAPDPAGSAAVPASLASTATRCISIGPFLDAADAARAAATLRGGGYRPKQRVAVGEVSAGVWVYLDLPPTPDAVANLRAKLAQARLKDALEMPGPNGATVISLGLYSEATRAQARAALVRTLGLRPHVAERTRSGDVYWIDVHLKSTDPNLTPSEFGGIEGRIVRLQVVPCPGA